MAASCSSASSSCSQTQNEESNNNNRGYNWGDEETLLLISVWGEDAIQAQLDGTVRNKKVWQSIANRLEAYNSRGCIIPVAYMLNSVKVIEMGKGVESKNIIAENGYTKSGEACKNRIKNMKQTYKKIKDHNNKSGNGKKTYKFFDAMDRILGTRPATRPANLLETSMNSETQDVDEFDDEEEQRATTTDEISETDENEIADPVEHARNHQLPEKRGPEKKKRNRSDMIQRALNDATDTFIKFQKEQERIYLEFEEKRMKMEADSERLREEREDRRLEKVEEQRREDRERDRQHEYRLMSLFASHGNFVPQQRFSQQQFSQGLNGQSYQNL